MNTTIDLIGALLSILSGYFYIREKSFAWLISLTAIPLNITIDIRIGIYGDILLQLIYLALSIYGWCAWQTSNSTVHQAASIIRVTAKQFYTLLTLTLLTILGIWASINYYTDSNVALLDSSITVLSLLATWLLSRKFVESWLLWIVIDTLYLSLCTYKQIPLHGFTAIIDAMMCVVGYTYWMREYGSYKQQAIHACAPAQS